MRRCIRMYDISAMGPSSTLFDCSMALYWTAIHTTAHYTDWPGSRHTRGEENPASNVCVLHMHFNAARLKALEGVHKNDEVIISGRVLLMYPSSWQLGQSSDKTSHHQHTPKAQYSYLPNQLVAR